MTVLTDVDGVLLNWNFAFHRWMKKQGYTPVRDDSYELDVCYGLGVIETIKLCECFNASAEMGFLEPLHDARYWVRRLCHRHNVKFHAITSMGLDHYGGKLREMNLRFVFGKVAFEKIVILGCGADKTEALSEYSGSGLFWLEDNIHNAQVGASLGLRSLLFDREYNQKRLKNELFTRIKNWKEFSSILIQSDK